ncbi:MAG: hypothetical protein K2X77_32560 [Candidatus Obscuribacterales bacterium]|jgi:hypothetical protein|nr:hypothetical protein [Candidatus Obscuribacterales bacterium]
MLAPVLRDVFASSRASNKRILLVVIGDGTVSDPADADIELSKATDEADLGKRLRVLCCKSAKQIKTQTTMMLQVGTSQIRSQRVCISFRDLSKTGLLPAIEEMVSAVDKSPAPK